MQYSRDHERDLAGLRRAHRRQSLADGLAPPRISNRLLDVIELIPPSDASMNRSAAGLARCLAILAAPASAAGL